MVRSRMSFFTMMLIFASVVVILQSGGKFLDSEKEAELCSGEASLKRHVSATSGSVFDSVMSGKADDKTIKDGVVNELSNEAGKVSSPVQNVIETASKHAGTLMDQYVYDGE